MGVNMSGGSSSLLSSPFSQELAVTITTANTYQQALSLSGKGELKRASFLPASGTGKMKVTIDGTVVFEGGGISTYICGILPETDIFYNAGLVTRSPFNSTPIAVDSNKKNYPYTGAAEAICFLQNAIGFNKSLLIEIQASSTGASAVYMTMEGCSYV